MNRTFTFSTGLSATAASFLLLFSFLWLLFSPVFLLIQPREVWVCPSSGLKILILDVFICRLDIYEGHAATKGSNPTVAGSSEAESGSIQPFDLPLIELCISFTTGLKCSPSTDDGPVYSCFHVYTQQNKTFCHCNLFIFRNILQLYSTLALSGLK